MALSRATMGPLIPSNVAMYTAMLSNCTPMFQHLLATISVVSPDAATDRMTWAAARQAGNFRTLPAYIMAGLPTLPSLDPVVVRAAQRAAVERGGLSHEEVRTFSALVDANAPDFEMDCASEGARAVMGKVDAKIVPPDGLDRVWDATCRATVAAYLSGDVEDACALLAWKLCDMRPFASANGRLARFMVNFLRVTAGLPAVLFDDREGFASALGACAAARAHGPLRAHVGGLRVSSAVRIARSGTHDAAAAEAPPTDPGAVAAAVAVAGKAPARAPAGAGAATAAAAVAAAGPTAALSTEATAAIRAAVAGAVEAASAYAAATDAVAAAAVAAAREAEAEAGRAAAAAAEPVGAAPPVAGPAGARGDPGPVDAAPAPTPSPPAVPSGAPGVPARAPAVPGSGATAAEDAAFEAEAEAAAEVAMVALRFMRA